MLILRFLKKNLQFYTDCMELSHTVYVCCHSKKTKSKNPKHHQAYACAPFYISRYFIQLIELWIESPSLCIPEYNPSINHAYQMMRILSLLIKNTFHFFQNKFLFFLFMSVYNTLLDLKYNFYVSNTKSNMLFSIHTAWQIKPVKSEWFLEDFLSLHITP